MIRLCDKECYIIGKNQMSRLDMMMFFINGHRHDVLQLVEEDMTRVGIVTYKDLVEDTDGIRICTKEFVINDNFWKEATAFFKEKQAYMAPVYNEAGEPLGFCYDDGQSYSWIDEILKKLEIATDIPLFIKEVYPKIEQVCIYDCNEYAYRFYQILKKHKFPVCVIGEKWTWFGIETMEGIYDYPEYAKINVFAEGTWLMRDGKEFEVLRRSEVERTFGFLQKIICKNIRQIKKDFADTIQGKPIQMYDVILPRAYQLEYMTELEEKSRTLGDVAEVLLYHDNCSGELKQLVYEIYDKQLLDSFREKGVCTEMLLNIEDFRRIGKKPKIYVVGNCIVGGHTVRAEESLTNQLQKQVGDSYQVEPCFFSVWDYMSLRTYLRELPMRKQDIILFVERDNLVGESEYESDPFYLREYGLETFYLKEYYEDKERGTWFGNEPIHSNALGNQKIAEAIYKGFLAEKLANSPVDKGFVQMGEALSQEKREQVEEYLDSIKKFDAKSGDRIGAIVMNCNPFTLGHQYLIEYAAEKMDYLYVFVVQEDRSEFKFQDRFRMVQEGTKHLNNVKVNPSGEFMISYETLQIYFGKASRQEEKVDAGMDLQIFGQYIAPRLGITCRFVGEEPTDKVTRQYNEQMKDILELYGVSVCEIPRKTIGEKVISASYVRKCLKEKDLEGVKELVPETTYQALEEFGYLK